MGWIILEGIDRSGKSSVADAYREQGCTVVHFKAPDKKYTQPGYTGPSYLDDLVEQLIEWDGKDVIFDRSWYGELVWPRVYGRKPLLEEDDFEIIKEFEDRNQAERILMIDPDSAAHWKRCVDNKEPLNHGQFKIAGSLYNNLAHKNGFMPKQLKDFDALRKNNDKQIETTSAKQNSLASQKEAAQPQAKGTAPVQPALAKNSQQDAPVLTGTQKLERANAISAVIGKRIIKQRGGAFDELELDVNTFLKRQLDELLGEKVSNNSPLFSEEEVQILRIFCQRLREKETAANPTVDKKPVRR